MGVTFAPLAGRMHWLPALAHVSITFWGNDL